MSFTCAESQPGTGVAKGQAIFSAAVPGSPFTASMLRDVEGGRPVEADHMLGDLLKRSKGADTPVLRAAYIHLKAYEARRAREGKA